MPFRTGPLQVRSLAAIFAVLPCLALGQKEYGPYKHWPNPKPSDGYYWYLKAADLLPSAGFPRAGLNEADVRLFMNKVYPLLQKGLSLPVTDGRTEHVPWTLYTELAYIKGLARWSVRMANYDFQEGHPKEGYKWLSTTLRFTNHQSTPAEIHLLVQIASRAICLRAIKDDAKYLTRSQIRELDRLAAAGMNSRKDLQRVASHAQEELITILTKDQSKIANAFMADDKEAKDVSDFVNHDPSGVKVLCEAYRKQERRQARLFTLPEGQWATANLGSDTPPVDEIPNWKSRIHERVGLLKFLNLIEQLSAGPIPWRNDPIENRELIRMTRIALHIELYRRKHKSLPASLADLHDHWLTTDPLTGYPFGYTLAKDRKTFDLYTDGIKNGKRLTLSTPKPLIPNPR